MTTDEKYGVLQRAASLVATQADRTSLLEHHERIHTVIRNMLMGRKRAPKRSDGVTKDNPTGNPFKKLHKPVPTVVSSAQDRSMTARRAASDMPDASFD